jgi:uncharacterized protein DUF2442
MRGARRSTSRSGRRLDGDSAAPGPWLERATAADLTAPAVSPAGDALCWPALDLDVHVAGLVERAFGSRLFAAATGRQGRKRRSKAKAVAAKLNGAKGGRPRKKLSA